MTINDKAFYYYFHFIQKRMEIFWKKNGGEIYPWTDDEILLKNKFTNTYRALDRVSQYLIKNVIYKIGNYDEIDTLFRILVFKIFNKIETWEYLESTIGDINIRTFEIEKIISILDKRIKDNTIFNGAYIMTGSHGEYKQYKKKHETRLYMLRNEFIKNRGFEEILSAKSMEQVYNIMIGKPLIGGFLAYQYTVDFNYSDVINFDENDFVKAGIGAQRGIKKCFSDYEGNFEKAIRYTQENFDKFIQKYEIKNLQLLPGRGLTLIDIQNCFCETDKYLRVKMPDLKVGNIRIKQIFRQNNKKIDYFFPPKWNINTLN